MSLAEPLKLRDQPSPAGLVVIRLGSVTLDDAALVKSAAECHERWGIWGFSVLEVPDGDFHVLARLRPLVATRRWVLVAVGLELVEAGFALLPTLDHPHWTVVLSEPSVGQFASVRRLFRGPTQNPAWTRRA